MANAELDIAGLQVGSLWSMLVRNRGVVRAAGTGGGGGF